MAAKKYLLISDLDGTLIGDEEALKVFAKWIQAHKDFLSLVYATGRTFDSVVQEIQTTALPEPNVIITSVGTDIYDYPSGELMKIWHEKINKNWDAETVRKLFSSHSELELQPEQFQSAFKASYYLPDASHEQILKLKKQLRKTSIEAEVIYSSNCDLDFLPLRASKGKASAFLASRWYIPPQRVLVCGDTGNDKALFEQGFRGIVVGNAQPELKSLRGPGVYHADGFFACGVLEGIRYWWEKI
jgi:sucrose phosphatase-like protein